MDRPKDNAARTWRKLKAALRHRRRGSESAQSLVEFALVLPLFLILIFAVVDFGRAFFTWQVLTNASREGARAGAVQNDLAGIENKIYLSFCSDWPSDPDSCAINIDQLTIATDNVQGPRGENVTVSLTYDFDYVTPVGALVNLVSGGTIDEPTISSTTSMRLE